MLHWPGQAFIWNSFPLLKGIPFVAEVAGEKGGSEGKKEKGVTAGHISCASIHGTEVFLP